MPSRKDPRKPKQSRSRIPQGRPGRLRFVSATGTGPDSLQALAWSEVDGVQLDTFLRTDRPIGAVDRLVARVPSVPPGPDGTREIPERLVPHHGYLVAAGIALREENRLIDGVVVGLLRFTIALNGVLVYCPPRPAQDMETALLEAHHALRKLRAHTVSWWHRPSWEGRPVWYQGVPCFVAELHGSRGCAVLVAQDGHLFVPSGLEIEHGGPFDEPRQTCYVDILDPSVTWVRTRMLPATAADAEPVESEDQPTQREADDDVEP